MSGPLAVVHRSPYPARTWTRVVWLIWMSLLTIVVCGIAMVLVAIAVVSVLALVLGLSLG